MATEAQKRALNKWDKENKERKSKLNILSLKANRLFDGIIDSLFLFYIYN